jgi:hypothetical protein
MPLENNLELEKKSIILNKIYSDHMKSLIFECEYYKNKTNLLEIQLFYTKVACHSLVKDIYDITKDMQHIIEKP